MSTRPPDHHDRDPEQTRDGRIKSGKLAGKSLSAAIWVLAWPILMQQTMQACVGLADKIFAGHLDDAIRVQALDGVGVGSYVGWLIMIAMAGLGIGGQAIIARAMGAGRVDEAHDALAQAMSLSIIWGAIVGVGIWFAAEPLAMMAGLEERASEYLTQYVRILAVSMPLAAVMMVGGQCLHGAGETTKPALIAIGVNIVNILVSWILSGAEVSIQGAPIPNPTGFRFDVIGIACGTAGSYLFGAVITMFVLFRGVKDLRLESRRMPVQRRMFRRIIRIGVPNFFEGISMWAVNLFVLMFIGTIAMTTGDGNGLQGAHVIAIQWEAFSFMPGFAIGVASGALAGQYLGAGNPAMAQKAVLVCTGTAVVVMGLMGVVFITIPEVLTAVVSSEPIHMEMTPPLLRICGAVQIMFAVTMVVRQSLRGVGDTKWTFIITTVSSYGIRLPACWVLGVYFGLGLNGIWMGLCGELSLRALFFLARFRHGGWKRLRV